MLPRLTAPPYYHHRLNEDYYSKPPPPDEKIPENFKKNITRLDELGHPFQELSKGLIYDYVSYVFCQLINSQDSERRPILDGGYALHYYLTNPLKDVFAQYTIKHSAASCIPVPCRTDIDLLDRFYSSFGENSEEAFMTDLADCIRYGMGSHSEAIAAFCSDAVDIQEYESYQEASKRKERVIIKRHLKSRSLSICMSHPLLTTPQGTSPLSTVNHIIRVDLNFASNHLKPYHSQPVKIGRHPTFMPVRVLDDILFNHCHTLIYSYPGDEVRNKFIERITVFHNLIKRDPKINLEKRTINLIDWTMKLLQSGTRPDETILSIEETSRSFNYETVAGFKHSATIAEHEVAQRSAESETVQIQEASRKKETRYDLEEKTTLVMAHKKEALFELEALHEIPPLPEQVTVEATIHEPVKPTVSEAVSVKLEELTPLIVKATDEVAIACKLDVAPETPAPTPVSQLTPSISPVASETTQISDSDLSLDVPGQESDKKQKTQKTAMSKYQLKKQRQRKTGKRRDTKPQIKKTSLIKAPETESIPSRDRAEAQLLVDSGTTADLIQKPPMMTMTPESKSDTDHQVELLAKKDTTTKTSEQLKSVTSEPEATPFTAARPKKMIQHEKDPQKLLELIDKTANNIQSFGSVHIKCCFTQ
ncbi:hypothetical protein [Kistimonas asteriae]|uniref:hypothetical protein n=1 Tax=Kistimonas asteriae TaxID=517724 RepID=UPI001BAD6830|nr:hypothetical protein [Kistimonas asteriae]